MESSEMRDRLRRLESTVNAVVLGKAQVVRHALSAVIAGGHLLLEDVPGVGKTTLAQTIADALGCSFRRIQFTSDLLPSDILGINVFLADTAQFDFRPGPIFAHVVLADEINRTTPKTQSSLLEAMNEGQVSIDNQTRPLPEPFVVIATQNPQDFHGTYPLPESQLDRFMVRLRMGYPADSVERSILKARRRSARPPIEAALTLDEFKAIQAAVDAVRVDDLIVDYLLAIVAQTRRNPQIDLGVSTRGALALQRAAQARALLDERDFVLPDDIKALAVPVLAHRIQLGGVSEGDAAEAEQLISRLVDQVAVPV
jgi:MoxR-like ATPase